MSNRSQVFIDGENVGAPDLGRLDGKPVDVTLVLGHRQGLTVRMVDSLRQLPIEQVTLIQSTAPGRNALDFVLACEVGRAVERHPGAAIHIVSGDKGFGAMVNHLRKLGVTVTRHDSLASVPGLAPEPTTASASGDADEGETAVVDLANGQAPAAGSANGVKLVLDPEDVQTQAAIIRQALQRIKASRPRKRTTLEKFIKSQLKAAQPGAAKIKPPSKRIIDLLVAAGDILPTNSARLHYADDPPAPMPQSVNGGPAWAVLDDDQIPF